jgi:hypothetical protein
MATNRTAGYLNSQAKAVESGVNGLLCRVSLSATFSAGDVYFIGKLPHRAKLVRAVWIPGPAASGVGVFKVGLNGNSLSEDAIFGSATYSAAIVTGSRGNCFGNANGNLSLSDERLVRFIDVTFTPSAGVTVGAVGDVFLEYVLDDIQ